MLQSGWLLCCFDVPVIDVPLFDVLRSASTAELAATSPAELAATFEAASTATSPAVFADTSPAVFADTSPCGEWLICLWLMLVGSFCNSAAWLVLQKHVHRYVSCRIMYRFYMYCKLMYRGKQA
jgi:hypothetical protein